MERKTDKLIGVGQGPALSPLLFIIIMDVLASELGSKPPESMLFADYLVLCETSREKVEQELERWRDRGKTKKDHVKNEDIWREANVEPMTTFLR